MIEYKRIIYAIKHQETGRIYIGRTKNVNKRLYLHFRDLRKNQHYVELMQSDFNKYGGDYTVFILDFINNREESKKEFEWMDRYKTYDRNFGYNYQDPHYRKGKT